MPWINGEFQEPNNEDRANFAWAAVNAYAAETRSGGERVVSDPRLSTDTRAQAEEVISDLLCDLRHLAVAWDIDWEAVDERGRWHFDFEVAEAAVQEQEAGL